MVFKDEYKIDHSKPSAIPQKLFDVAKLNNIGWKAKIRLDTLESRIRKAGRPQKIMEMLINVTLTLIILSCNNQLDHVTSWLPLI